MDDQITPVAPVPPVPAAPPTLPPAEKSKNWPKILLIVVGVLVVLGLFGNIYLLAKNQKPIAETSPTPTPIATTPTQAVLLSTPIPAATANWETYTNSEKGYSVKYPSEKYVRLLCPQEELTLIKRQPDDTRDMIDMPTCNRGGRYDLEIVTSDKDNYIPKTDEYYSVTQQEIIVDGVKAVKYNYNVVQIKEPMGPGLDWVEQVHINHSEKTYIIFSGVKEYGMLLDQILSTFKFL